MKFSSLSLRLFCALALLSATSCSRAAVVAQYSFDDSSPNATSVSPDVTASPVSKGAGVQMSFDVANGEPAPAIMLSGLENPNEAGAAFNKDYIEFGVKPKAGKSLKLTDLSFDVAGGEGAANAPNRNFFVRSSLDDYKATLGKGIRYYKGKSENFTLNLADKLEFANIGADGVTFRIYAFAGVNNADIRFDNITLGADGAAPVATNVIAPQQGVDTIKVDFTRDPPLEKGLVFDRSTKVSAGVHQDGGKETPAWVARGTIEKQMQWFRSFRFKVTDPKFQNGGRPSVDIRVVYSQTANGPVQVRADNASGDGWVGQSWGNSGGWQVMNFKLDNAFFGARDKPDMRDPKTSGWDLRIDGVNSDLWLKSVEIIGYDTKENINWARLLKVKGARAEKPGGIFAFGKAADNKIDFELNNNAAVARPLRYKLRINDTDDKVKLSKDGTVEIAPSGAEKLPFTVDTKAWPLGPYEGKISFYLDDTVQEPALERSFRLGVISDSQMSKARAGEFLYGLDIGNNGIVNTGDETALAYLRLMGVDLVRSMPNNLGDTGQTLQTMAREGVQAAFIEGMPYDADAGKHAKNIEKFAAKLEKMAADYGGEGAGKIHFWELGNEPDLPFFYAGPIAQYNKDMNLVAAAIKRGAGANPVAVMNGGLSFAGNEGDQRSREFIDLVDPTKIDILAYHAHGPGIGAERNTLQKVVGEAAKKEAAKMPLLDTETGFAADNRSSLQEQARTVVEKFTYGQSQNLVSLYFFRLFMEGNGHVAGYGLTDNRFEPRPSVLAYRNMVEQLRHQKFVAALPFAEKAGTPGVNAFLFAESGADGQPTGRKTLVIFTEGTSSYDLSLRLDDAKAKVSSAQIVDLYGNAAPAKVLAGNAAQISVGADPIYLTWQSGGAARLASVLPSPLSIAADGALLAGADNAVTITARNISAAPLKAQIMVTANSRLPIEVTPRTRELTIPANGSVEIPLQVKLGAADAPLNLPHWWKVFVDADSAKMSAADWAQVPDALPAKNGTVTGAYAAAPGDTLAIDKVAGGYGERRNAIAYAVIDAPRAVKLPVAAYADFWMAWYVNGEKVYDGLQNGGGTLGDHLFELPLKAGRNVIAAQVQSGSQGWKLHFGGPAQREAAVNGKPADAVRVTLKSGDAVLSTQSYPLQISAPISALDAGAAPDALADWMKLEPLAVLGETNVTNFFNKEPDTSRWYQGETDLSAQVWLRDDGANLHLFAAVTDDKMVEAKSADDLGKSDNLRLVLTDDAGASLLDKTVGLVGGKVASSGQGEATATVSRDGTRTLYHIVISKNTVGAKPFRLALTVGDNDSDYLKQILELNGEGKGFRLATR